MQILVSPPPNNNAKSTDPYCASGAALFVTQTSMLRAQVWNRSLEPGVLEHGVWDLDWVGPRSCLETSCLETPEHIVYYHIIYVMSIYIYIYIYIYITPRGNLGGQ